MRFVPNRNRNENQRRITRIPHLILENHSRIIQNHGIAKFVKFQNFRKLYILMGKASCYHARFGISGNASELQRTRLASKTVLGVERPFLTPSTPTGDRRATEDRAHTDGRPTGDDRAHRRATDGRRPTVDGPIRPIADSRARRTHVRPTRPTD